MRDDVSCKIFPRTFLVRAAQSMCSDMRPSGTNRCIIIEAAVSASLVGQSSHIIVQADFQARSVSPYLHPDVVFNCQ